MQTHPLVRDAMRWILESVELGLRSRSVRTANQFAINAALIRLGIRKRLHGGGRRTLQRAGVLFTFDSWNGLLTLRKDYEPGIRTAIDTVATRDHAASETFIVIGAHVGRHALESAHRFATTIAVEPTPSTAGLLLTSVQRNGFDGRVHVIPAACADEDRRLLPFRVIDADSKNHVVFGGSSALHVPSVTVDALVRELRVARVALLLIDAEGAEASVLRGAVGTLRDQRPDVIVETLTPAAMDAVDAILRPLGYVGTAIDQHNTHYRSSGSA